MGSTSMRVWIKQIVIWPSVVLLGACTFKSERDQAERQGNEVTYAFTNSVDGMNEIDAYWNAFLRNHSEQISESADRALNVNFDYLPLSGASKRKPWSGSYWS
jgi:hypothetical protein